MADFRYLSDTDDEEESAAVEELISQAKDLCVLEQVAAIRCSSFTDSVLPTDLESRFRKLKSFPLTNKPKPKPDCSANADFSLSKAPPNPNSPPDLSVEKGVFSDLEENPDPVLKHESSKSPSASTSSMDFSPSPPKKTGCFFWLSPKKASSHDHHQKKKSKENGLDWDMNHEFLSDLSTFSTKKQQKMLKKAMKEEEKISREAQKIVNWAKQSSARLSAVSGIHDDELSDSN
ncbi:hypothetical protein SO802_034642 [Lithocarpus litseifolius]|uniref:Hepatoma-derived growth factor-related protein 2-like n=1 Tax=Lithocarpus litseifolius TaxID=425828 RepID=A0AAW2BJ28_9ROSI